MAFVLNNVKYELIKNEKDAFVFSDLEEAYTDYFTSFDYVLGDYSYGKLRLKGFNNKENKNFNSINDISLLEEYVHNYCAFGCRYFVISKVNPLK